jgi:hypothetical protein
MYKKGVFRLGNEEGEEKREDWQGGGFLHVAGQTVRPSLTINALLILKMQDIILFLQANYIMGHFNGCFEGVKKVEAPSKLTEKWPM